MPYYMQLVVLTDKGRKNFEDDPEWIMDINKEIELYGAKIRTQYALLGQYDFVNIIEAPSDEVAAKLAIKLSATGSVQPTTIAALPLENLIESLKKDPNTPW
ncbi:MAG: GYD domain-containing protein [Dehalococcoidales bacterium]|nr:GYD domain-containing protein [Dehalococcoidales bacterium]